MLQAVPKKFDVIFARRKGIGRSSKLVPKLSHENKLLLRRESFQFGNFSAIIFAICLLRNCRSLKMKGWVVFRQNEQQASRPADAGLPEVFAAGGLAKEFSAPNAFGVVLILNSV
jgi:hypothetical protein